MLSRLIPNHELRRFVLFLLVGVMNTAFGYAVYAVVYLIGGQEQVALILQYVLGVAWNYMAHARVVFGTSGFGRLPAYIAAYLGLYAFNAVALRLLVGAGTDPLVAGALLTLVSAVIAFFLISKALTGRWPVFEKDA